MYYLKNSIIFRSGFLGCYEICHTVSTGVVVLPCSGIPSRQQELLLRHVLQVQDAVTESLVVAPGVTPTREDFLRPRRPAPRQLRQEALPRALLAALPLRVVQQIESGIRITFLPSYGLRPPNRLLYRLAHVGVQVVP